MRWTILTYDGGATWYAERFEGADFATRKTFHATNLPNSLINKIEAQLSSMKARAGYNPQDTFIECRVRPKGVPENAGQRNSKASVILNFRDTKRKHKQLLDEMVELIVTNQEYDSLTWNEVPQ